MKSVPRSRASPRPRLAKTEWSSGKQFTVDLTLKLAGVAESVAVTAESPLIDIKASATTASIDAQNIDLIPKGRGLLSVLNQIPGTNSESRGGGLMDRRRFRLREPLPRRRRRSHNARTGSSTPSAETRSSCRTSSTPSRSSSRATTRNIARRSAASSTPSPRAAAIVPRPRGCAPDRQPVAGRHSPVAAGTAVRCGASRIHQTPRDKFHQMTWWPRSAARSSGTRAGSSSASRRSSTRRSGPSGGRIPSRSRRHRRSPTVIPTTRYQLQRHFAAGELAPRALHRQQRDAGRGPHPSEHPAGRQQHDERRHLQPAQHGVHRVVLECLQRLTRLVARPEDVRQHDRELSQLRLRQRRRQFPPRHATDVRLDEHRPGSAFRPACRTSAVSSITPPTPSRWGMTTSASTSRWTRPGYGRWRGDHALKIGGLYEHIGNQASAGEQHPNITLNWGRSTTRPTASTAPAKSGYFEVRQDTRAATSRRPTSASSRRISGRSTTN